MSPHFSYAAVGALYPAARRGLTADLLAGHALGVHAFPICTALIIAGHGKVTDLSEVPEDTVRAQLEHLSSTTPPAAVKIGALASHGAATAVLDTAARWGVPTILDLTIGGPQGETVLSPRGIEAVMQRLAVPDLVMIGSTDAELISGGEVRSLDDAQVAAQRVVRRGARAVLIKCGPLPSRHFEAEGENGTPHSYYVDLLYTGEDFVLYEAPYIEGPQPSGASSAHAAALVCALLQGYGMEESLKTAKLYVTEAIRRGTRVGEELVLSYFWQGSSFA